MNAPSRRRSALLAALIFLPASAEAQTSYPMLTRVQPTAVRRGESAEVTISGVHDFSGASALLFEGTGLSAEILDASREPPPARKKGRRPNQSSVKARIAVAANAAPGPREFRVATPQGISSVGLLVVAADPVVAEADDKANDDPAGAQDVALPSVIAGAVGKGEDVDWYRIRARAGQKVALSVWGNRLEDKIHDLQMHLDPILVLHDERGRELAADDNAQFADPRLIFEFKETGTYLVEVRDTAYAGNPNWTYVLQATTGPFATSVFPMAVRPGAPAELKATGVNFDPSRAIRLDIPPDAKPGPLSLPLPTTQGATPPVPLVATDLPLATESDDAPSESDKAQPIRIPVALSGRLGEANDLDAYRFEAGKGRSYRFEVMARRVGSEADPVLRVLDAQGKTLAEADDTFGKDPRLEWTAPADGAFAVQLNDLHSRGGEGFGYVLLAEEARPDFVLTCDPDKLNLGPGARTPLFVKVARQSGYKGAVALQWEGLPPGVTASPLTIPEAMTQGEIVLSASPDAKLAATLPTLTGRGEGPDGPILRPVAPKEEIYLPGGGRGLYDVDMLAVAVTEPSDITLDADPAEVALKPGQAATIDVTVKRREGFEGPVNLAVELSHLGQIYANPLPTGVTVRASGSKTLLGPKEAAGKIVLEARPDAPAIEGVPIAVMGHVSINFVVKTAYCTAPIRLSVLPKDGVK